MLPSTLYIISRMHLQSLKLLCPTVKERLFLQENTLYDFLYFSTLYTTLPHNLIKDKLIDLIEKTFQREGSPYLACNGRNAFFYFRKT